MGVIVNHSHFLTKVLFFLLYSLYMSYSNIKARFGGDITFDVSTGKGTTFNIIIPIKK